MDNIQLNIIQNAKHVNQVVNNAVLMVDAQEVIQNAFKTVHVIYVKQV